MDELTGTQMFGDLTVTYVDEADSPGPYGHTFGGPLERSGTSREECGDLHLHRVMLLDQTDPAVPKVVPEIRWLPLYYCFDFRANVIGYRVLSEDAVRVFLRENDPHVTSEESWIRRDFPATLPVRPLVADRRPFEPHNPEHAWRYGGVFGVEHLGRNERLAVRRFETEHALIGLNDPTWPTPLADQLGMPFFQGKPDNVCLNPECPLPEAPRPNERGRLKTFAIVENAPIEDFYFTGRYDNFRLIYEVCRDCWSIHVSN